MTGSFGEFAVCGSAENYGGCLLGLHANAHDAGVANSVSLAALNAPVANGLGQPAGGSGPVRQQCGDGTTDPWCTGDGKVMVPVLVPSPREFAVIGARALVGTARVASKGGKWVKGTFLGLLGRGHSIVIRVAPVAPGVAAAQRISPKDAAIF
jgi:hypothetical protein